MPAQKIECRDVDGLAKVDRKTLARHQVPRTSLLQLNELLLALRDVSVDQPAHMRNGQKVGKQHRKYKWRAMPILRQWLQQCADERGPPRRCDGIDLAIRPLLLRLRADR